VLPRGREVMGEEDRVKNQDQDGYPSLWEMLQGPVPNTVRTRSLAALETLNGFLNLLRFGYLGFASRGHEVKLSATSNISVAAWTEETVIG